MWLDSSFYLVKDIIGATHMANTNVYKISKNNQITTEENFKDGCSCAKK